MKVNNIVPRFSKWAEISKQKIFAVPLTETKHVEIAFNDSSMDAFLIDGKKLINAHGFREPDPEKYVLDLADIYARLNWWGVDTAKVAEAYRNAALNISK